MRSFFATLRQLTIPAGAQPGTPRIVLGPDVPTPLTTLGFGFDPSAAALWYFNATDFFFIAIGDSSLGPRTLIGTYSTARGVTVFQAYGGSGTADLMTIGTTAFDSNAAQLQFLDIVVDLFDTTWTWAPGTRQIFTGGVPGAGLTFSSGSDIALNSGSDVTYAGDSILNWQPWTPAPTGTMVFGGAPPSASGQFLRVGDTYDAEAIITLGAGFAIGDAAVSLPATPSAGITYDLGTASFTDTSTGQVYFGRCRRIGTGMRFEYINAAGQYAVITGALPFAFAATDVIRINSVRYHV